MKKKNFWILFSLFILPLVFYILILTGTNNFAKLPVLTEKVSDVTHFSTESEQEISLKGKISILVFLGDNIDATKTNALNLNEKIYKRFHQFTDFQFVVILPKGTEEAAKQLKSKIAFATNMSKFNFVFGSQEEIRDVFSSLGTTYELSKNGYSEYAFILDKERNLRGRSDDEDIGMLYGYSAETVAPIHNKMVDDVKVLVAEYRMALKKNKREI